MRRRTMLSLCGFTAASPLLLPARGRAQQAWPSRPVTILVPFVAGGASDIAARAISLRMQQSIGKPLVVENRPGANGEVAGRQFARSAPDGHTLMVASIGVFAINPALRPNLGYDPVKQFAPVTLAVTTPNVLVVNPKTVTATDFAGFLDWLKKNRGKASYSTSGIGSSDHLTAELFKQLTDTDPQHIPYAGGAQAITALMSDDVQLSFQNLGSVLPHLQEGRLRAIIVTAAERHPQLPQVPTAAEAGLRDFVVTSWQAVMAPAGTPQPLLARLHDEAAKALREPEATQRLEQIGFTVVANSPEEYGAFQRAEIDRWRKVIETGGIKPE